MFATHLLYNGSKDNFNKRCIVNPGVEEKAGEIASTLQAEAGECCTAVSCVEKAHILLEASDQVLKVMKTNTLKWSVDGEHLILLFALSKITEWT